MITCTMPFLPDRVLLRARAARPSYGTLRVIVAVRAY